jgi:hypothetical protein
MNPWAVKTSQALNPNIQHLGPIEGVTPGRFPCKPGLFTAGPPCQDVSIGTPNRQGLSGARSGLFYPTADLWDALGNPHGWFESVASMTPQTRDAISNRLGISPVLLDAGHVGGVSRPRLFWPTFPVKPMEGQGVDPRELIDPARHLFDPFNEHRTYRLTEGTQGYEKNTSKLWKPMRGWDLPKARAWTRAYGAHGIPYDTVQLEPGGQIWRWTPRAGEMLHGIPEGTMAAAGAPWTEQKKMIGNGWDIPTVKHLLKAYMDYTQPGWDQPAAPQRDRIEIWAPQGNVPVSPAEPTVAPKMVAPAPGSEMFQRRGSNASGPSLAQSENITPSYGRSGMPLPGGEHGNSDMPPSSGQNSANYPPEKSIEELIAEKLYARAQPRRTYGWTELYPFMDATSAATQMFHPAAANEEYLNPSMWLSRKELKGTNPSLHAYLTDYATSAVPDNPFYTDTPNKAFPEGFDWHPSTTRALSSKESDPIIQDSKTGKIFSEFWDNSVDLTNPKTYRKIYEGEHAAPLFKKIKENADLEHWEAEHVANLSQEPGDWTLYHPVEEPMPDPTARYRKTGGEHQFVVPPEYVTDTPPEGVAFQIKKNTEPISPPSVSFGNKGGHRPSPIVGSWNPVTESFEPLPYSEPKGRNGWRRGAASSGLVAGTTAGLGFPAASAYADAIQNGATHEQAVKAAAHAGLMGALFSAAYAAAPKLVEPAMGGLIGADATRDAITAATGQAPSSSSWLPTVGGLAGVASMFNPVTRAATMGYGMGKMAEPFARPVVQPLMKAATGAYPQEEAAQTRRQFRQQHRAVMPQQPPIQLPRAMAQKPQRPSGVQPGDLTRALMQGRGDAVQEVRPTRRLTPEQEEAIRQYVARLRGYTPPNADRRLLPGGF